jgi:16S rRNA (guanine966-N2)-methyltransferase
LAFHDPPKGHGLAEKTLATAVHGGWLAPGAIVVVEERKGTPPCLPAGYAEFDRRTWGDTQVLFARFTGARSIGVSGDLT